MLDTSDWPARSLRKPLTAKARFSNVLDLSDGYTDIYSLASGTATLTGVGGDGGATVSYTTEAGLDAQGRATMSGSVPSVVDWLTDYEGWEVWAEGDMKEPSLAFGGGLTE